jgi:hypothetical protein
VGTIVYGELGTPKMTDLIITDAVHKLFVRADDYAYENAVPPILAIQLALSHTPEVDFVQFAWYCHSQDSEIFSYKLVYNEIESRRLHLLEIELKEKALVAFSVPMSEANIEKQTEEAEDWECLQTEIGKNMQSMFDNYYGEPSLCVL